MEITMACRLPSFLPTVRGLSLRSGSALAVVGLIAASLANAAAKPKLAAPYREFVNGPPSLLLTRPERDAFNALQTDAQRDTFIEHFWNVRNPTPGLQNNEFKEEFYRRVAYADSFYGKDSGSKGWRTARGRTYVLFGKPQTSMNYQGNQELYPTELWFYSNPGIAELPPFFYVLFFEGDGVSGYHFYHPYTDGPDKLMRSGGQSKAHAYQYLHNISAELANATLSFIPGEPIDTDTYTGSMQSMQVINAIEGFNEMPSYVALISTRSQRLERVTSRVEYKLARTNLLTYVAMQEGKPWVHWRMEVSDPAQPKWANGKATLRVSSRLFSRGRLVLEQSDDPSFAVPAAAAEQINKRPVVYEDMIPVAAGQYQLTVAVTNKQSGEVYEASKAFEIKGPADRTALGDVLVVAKHELEPRKRAFQFGGVEFYPSAENYTTASHGLSILYQIQLPAQRPAALNVHYTVGQVSSGVKKTFDEKLNLESADAAGTLLTAKTLPIQELAPGQYRLSIRVEDPGSGKISAAAIPFIVASENPTSQPIVIARGQNESPQGQAAVHYERALCLLSQDRPSEAIQNLKASWELSKNSTVKSLLEHLSASSPGANHAISGEGDVPKK
jgi:GWxTD domain-containing protein